MGSIIQHVRAQLQEYVDRAEHIPTRDDVVAYATLAAWVGHFPARSEPSDFRLLQSSASIFEIEKDRFFKQRRIALQKLATSNAGSGGFADIGEIPQNFKQLKNSVPNLCQISVTSCDFTRGFDFYC